MFRRVPATHADSQGLRDGLRHGQQIGHGRERTPHVVGVEPGDDYLLAAVGQLVGNIYQALVEEVRFVDANHLSSRVEELQDLGGGLDAL